MGLLQYQFHSSRRYYAEVTGRNYSDYIKEYIIDLASMDNIFDSYWKKTLSNLALSYDEVREEGKSPFFR